MGSRKVGLKYQYQTFGVRNRVERFFGYLKQRTRSNISTTTMPAL